MGDAPENVNENGVVRIKADNRWLKSWNIKYLKSTRGILRIVTLFFALIAFVAEESTPYCHYGYKCVVPAFIPTYRYFAFVTMATVIVSVVMIVVNLNRHLSHDLIKPLRLLYAETSILACVAVLLLFADIFLIGQSGARISYQVAAVLGTISLIAAEAHLILIAMQLRKMLKRRKKCRGREVTTVASVSVSASVSDHGRDIPRRERPAISEPVLLSAVDKNACVYANCEEPINHADEMPPEYGEYSDSFDDSSDDDGGGRNYPHQVRLEIAKK